ncbi:hypothetical protein IQ61_23710 [Streptomyces scabiei]|nr:hypothetical protein IQ61_23710 [Streptomyces scabiei]
MPGLSAPAVTVLRTRSVRRLGQVTGVAYHPACRDTAGRGAHADLTGDLYVTYVGMVLAVAEPQREHTPMPMVSLRASWRQS